jgi:hypothetical protein
VTSVAVPASACVVLEVALAVLGSPSAAGSGVTGSCLATKGCAEQDAGAPAAGITSSLADRRS